MVLPINMFLFCFCFYSLFMHVRPSGPQDNINGEIARVKEAKHFPEVTTSSLSPSESLDYKDLNRAITHVLYHVRSTTEHWRPAGEEVVHAQRG